MDHFLTATSFFTRAECLTQTIFIDSNDFTRYSTLSKTPPVIFCHRQTSRQTSAALFMFIRDSARDCTSKSLRVALNNPNIHFPWDQGQGSLPVAVRRAEKQHGQPLVQSSGRERERGFHWFH